MNVKYKACYDSGKIAEIKFVEMAESKGMKVEKTTDSVDIYEHIDFWIYYKGNKWSVDVKSTKRVTEHLDDNLHWIEMKNVKGDLGWIYGKADMIVFELIGYWLVVPRQQIVSFIEKYVSDELVDNKKNAIYKKYSRQQYGRNDIIALLKVQDLMFMADRIWKKTEKEFNDEIIKIQNKNNPIKEFDPLAVQDWMNLKEVE